MNTVATWLVRYGHVLAAGVRVGGYALLAFVVVPLLEREPSATVGRLAVTAVRVLTYAGTLTVGFGLVLITYTRGVVSLFRGGEWGFLVIASFLAAIALFGIGDGALRPALVRLAAGEGDGGDGKGGRKMGKARRFAVIGFALTALTVGMMTRAVYAGS